MGHAVRDSEASAAGGGLASGLASVEIVVSGDPVPQPRHRVTARGNRPRTYLPASHPVHDWKAAVRDAWSLQARDARPVTDVQATLAFRIQRPASHLKADGSVRDAAPKIPGRRAGDVDNLAKAVLDALHGLAFEDDADITFLAVTKRWTTDEPGVAVAIVGNVS